MRQLAAHWSGKGAAVRVAMVNAKGGVGKTTSAVYIASGLARSGRALLVDTDPDASAQSWAEQAGEGLGYTTVGLVRGVQAGVERLAREGAYAHVVIDTPPGHGDREIARAALLVADIGVMPLSPRLLDADRLRSTVRLLAEVSETRPKLKPYVLLNQVRQRTTMSRLVREFLEAEEFPMLPAVSLREQYAQAFGEPIGNLGEWSAVVEALLAEAG